MTTKSPTSTYCFTDVGGSPGTLEAYLENSVEYAATELVFDVSDQLLPNLTQADLTITITALYVDDPPTDDLPQPKVRGFRTDLSPATTASEALSHYSSASNLYGLTKAHPAAVNAGVSGTLTFDLLSGTNNLSTITSGPGTITLFLTEDGGTVAGKAGIRFSSPSITFNGGDVVVGTDTGCASVIPGKATTHFGLAGVPFFIDDQLGMGWYAYPYSPEGVIDAKKGSICQTPVGVYRKSTTFGTTGWVKL